MGGVVHLQLSVCSIFKVNFLTDYLYFFFPILTFHSKTTIPIGLSCYCFVANSDHLADINTFIALVLCADGQM